jgi:aminopeptidase-like protein
VSVRIADLGRSVDLAAAGREMHQLIEELYPLCRSITGPGLRATLDRIAQDVPLARHEVPTGTRVLDWTVPREWSIRDAWVKNARGERVIDFRRSNLHVLQYSVPVHRRMSLAELRPHLHTLPDRPGWIPYRTSYYEERWGFCLEHARLAELPDGEYEVCIDSTLTEGSLSYGECVLRGETADEVLLSCHVCHPSLCNDNLSGIAVCTQLARHLGRCARRYTYRFLFAPGTIGALAWLSRNEPGLAAIRHGLVVACVGDPGTPHYKRSRRGADVDRAVELVLRHAGGPYEVRPFSPYGYDERQYCSPGFDLPVGSLTRTPHGEFPEYHTSADDPSLVTAVALGASLGLYLEVLAVLEEDRRYRGTNPKGEPQLGRRGLYGALGGLPHRRQAEMAMLWVLNLADGRHSLLDVAERAGLDFRTVHEAATLLREHGLLEAA